MLEKEFKYFLDNKEKLTERFLDKFIFIVGEDVFGPYNTLDEAYNAAIAKFELGTFLIQECTPGNDSYTQIFHSRAIFA